VLGTNDSSIALAFESGVIVPWAVAPSVINFGPQLNNVGFDTLDDRPGNLLYKNGKLYLPILFHYQTQVIQSTPPFSGGKLTQ
jgi:hypothetical protein